VDQDISKAPAPVTKRATPSIEEQIQARYGRPNDVVTKKRDVDDESDDDEEDDDNDYDEEEPYVEDADAGTESSDDSSLRSASPKKTSKRTSAEKR
jgi:hypothetical protein